MPCEKLKHETRIHKPNRGQFQKPPERDDRRHGDDLHLQCHEPDQQRGIRLRPQRLHLGNRTQQNLGVDVTRYPLDMQPGLAYVIGDSEGSRYVHAPRGIHAAEGQAGNWQHVMTDALGSVRGYVGDHNRVLGLQSYSLYGVPDAPVGSVGTPFRFTGEMRDGNGLQYHRARYLSPALGGWLSLDPWEGMAERIMSMNGYAWVEGNVVNAEDADGLCLKSTLTETATEEEVEICRWRIAVLSILFGINLQVKSQTIDELWTTTRVAEVIRAAFSIEAALFRNKAGVSFKQVFGNTTLSAGVADLAGCASTESGVSSNNIDWGACTISDPYSAFNIIHELGHVLQFRNDYYPRGEDNRPRDVWDRMLVLSQGNADDVYITGILFDPHAGFASEDRQNTGQGGRNHDEEVADMFLFWVEPLLEFDATPAGQLRSMFVNGFTTDNFEDSGYGLIALGMAGWARTAAQAAGMQQSASIPLPVPESVAAQLAKVPCLPISWTSTGG